MKTTSKLNNHLNITNGSTKMLNNVIKKTLYVVFAFTIVVTAVSCTGDEGPVGPPGQDGQNGIDGQDGVDGNANVQTFKFDVSTFSGYIMSLELPAITSSVLSDDVILGYFRPNTNYWYQMPGGGYEADYVTRPFTRVGYYDVRFHNWDGSQYDITEGELQEIKVIIIESSSVTNARGVNNQDKKVLLTEQLRAAGVDISNYYAVCDYYGLTH